MKSQYITPALTLFDSKGRLDRDQNLKLYSHLSRGGVSGFVVMGSTGEFCSLSMAASRQLIDICSSFSRGAMRVYAGASRIDPDESIELANHAYEKGLDGVMIVGPYYFCLNDESIYDYYSRIASGTKCNIFLYNFPARTGYSISPEVCLKLVSRFPNITGFKDTITDTIHTSKIIKTVKKEFPHFEVFCGYDNNFAHNVLSGGNGCIGALSNLDPEFFATFIDALAREDLAGVARCQQRVDKMMGIYDIADLFIPVLKKALLLRGVIDSDFSLPPLLNTNEEQNERLAALLHELGTFS